MPKLIKVKVKPLSVNELWRGRRFPTDKYKAYRKELVYTLPNIENFPEPPYKVEYEFGISNPKSDYDNCIKGFQDALQNRYEFDDKHIMEAHIRKVVVPRGEEYIAFDISKLNILNKTQMSDSAADYFVKHKK